MGERKVRFTLFAAERRFTLAGFPCQLDDVRASGLQPECGNPPQAVFRIGK